MTETEKEELKKRREEGQRLVKKWTNPARKFNPNKVDKKYYRREKSDE